MYNGVLPVTHYRYVRLHAALHHCSNSRETRHANGLCRPQMLRKKQKRRLSQKTWQLCYKGKYQARLPNTFQPAVANAATHPSVIPNTQRRTTTRFSNRMDRQPGATKAWQGHCYSASLTSYLISLFRPSGARAASPQIKPLH